MEQPVRIAGEWRDLAVLDRLHRQDEERQRAAAMTWEQLCRIEPRLALLALEIEQLSPEVRRSWRTYSAYKSRLEKFVGWFCDDERIRLSVHFDEAYRHTLQFLGEGAE
jgi:hypothetical protein